MTGKLHSFVKKLSQPSANPSLFSRSSVGVRVSHAVRLALSECLTTVTLKTSDVPVRGFRYYTNLDAKKMETRKAHSLAFYHVLFRLGKPRYCGSKEGDFKGGELMGFW